MSQAYFIQMLMIRVAPRGIRLEHYPKGLIQLWPVRAAAKDRLSRLAPGVIVELLGRRTGMVSQ